MNKITSIQRLMYATEHINGKSAMERQIQNTRDRLNQGIDITGSPFAPYKTERPTNHSRPLADGADLFRAVSYSVDRNVAGTYAFKASIGGEAARIAGYQNVRRKFLGYSERDRFEAKQAMLASIKEGMNQWR